MQIGKIKDNNPLRVFKDLFPGEWYLYVTHKRFETSQPLELKYGKYDLKDNCVVRSPLAQGYTTMVICNEEKRFIVNSATICCAGDHWENHEGIRRAAKRLAKLWLNGDKEAYSKFRYALRIALGDDEDEEVAAEDIEEAVKALKEAGIPILAK